MAIENAREYLKKFGMENRIMEFNVSSATVELAAQALGCEPERIAKSISLDIMGRTILIITAGDMKIDNHKYKETFLAKAVMLSFNEVEERIGHAVGGVCPFGIKENVEVYLDVSLKRFKTVFPACGSSNSAIEMSPEELERTSGFKSWVDVCKQQLFTK